MVATSTTADALHARDAAPARQGPQAALWPRLGSFVSMLPLGVWTLNHLWDNLAVYRGAEAWQKAVTTYPHPVAHLLTLTMVLLPLAIHTVWGIRRLFSFRPNNARYPLFSNFKYLLQRLSAVGVLFFLGAHIWLAMLHPRLVEGHAEPFSDIASQMRFHGPTLMVYLLGTLAVCYHLANGIFGFAWTWGLTAGEKSYRRIGVGVIVSFLVMLAMAWSAIYGLWVAGESFGTPLGI